MIKKILLLLITVNLFAYTPLELAKQYDKITSGFKSSIATMTMILINEAGQKIERKLTIKTLEGKKDEDKTLLTFLTPADIKGTKLLTYNHLKKSDSQWIYLPALKRTKRISSSNKSGSFMGSEFSYEDIANNSYKKYSYNDTIEVKNNLFKTIRVPKDRNSGYSKQIVYQDKKSFLVKKIEYYDRKKELLKTAIFDDYKKIKAVWRVGKMSMTNHQNGKKTILIWKDEKIKTGLKDRNFHKRVLKK